ncbi:MAG: OmpA family protein [Rhizobiaceae bacterium]
MKRYALFVAAGLLSAGLSGFDPMGAANAQSLDSSSIVNQLKPKETQKTRSLTRSFAAPKETDDQKFLKALPTRGIRIEQRQKLDEIVKTNDLPSIDIEIKFDYDSDKINPASVADVMELGKALTNDALKDSRIVLNGHTDAAGSNEYNQNLSDRRAASVRQFLIDNFGISADRLIAIGYGEERLKNENDPLAGENRRVEVINLTQG